MIAEKINATLRIYFDTVDPATGVLTNAGALPTVVIYKNGVSAGSAGATVTNKSTGVYELAVVLSAGAGYAVGDRCNAIISATVAGVAGAHCVADIEIVANSPDDLATAANLATTNTTVNTINTNTDTIEARLPAALIGGRLDATVGAMQSSVITASSILTGAITSTKFAAGAIDAAAIATDAIDADAMAASALAEIAAAVWAQVLESTYTAADMFRGAAAVLWGKVTDFSTGALVFRNITDTKNRITVGTGATGRTSSTTNDLT